MTQNLITSAFEKVRDVEHGVLLLDTFHRLAAREVPLFCLLPPPLALLHFPSFPLELSKHQPASIHALSHVLSCQCLFSSLCSSGFQIAKECDFHSTRRSFLLG